MSINDNSNQGTTSQQSTQSRGGYGPGDSNGNTKHTSRGGILGFGSRGRALDRNALGSQVDAYYNAMTECLKNSRDKEFKLIVADQSRTSTRVSAIVLTKMVGGRVLWYAYAIDASAPDLGKRVHRQGNGQPDIEIELVAGDILGNDVFQTAISRILTDEFGAKDALFLGGLSIPREMSHEDEARIHRVLFEGVDAISTYLDIQTQQGILTTDEFDKNTSLRFRVDQVHNENYTDITGMPRRNDFVMSIKASQRQQQNNNTGDDLVTQSSDLYKLRGYMDLIWAPTVAERYQAASNPAAVMTLTQNGYLQTYMPVFVITEIEAKQDGLGLQGRALALALTSALVENAYYLEAFRPNRKNPLRDTGLLPLDQFNAGYTFSETAPERIPTNAVDFNHSHHCSSVMRPEIMIAMDVRTDGPDGWMDGLFQDAALGDTDAGNTILAAMDDLVVGEFSRQANGTISSPVIPGVIRTHSGYYVDESGEQRDPAEIDYLTVLNVQGADQPTMMGEWAASFIPGQMTVEQQLDVRSRIIGLIQPNLVVRGFRSRVYLNTTALYGLYRCLFSKGVDIHNENVYANQNHSNRAGWGGIQGMAARGLSSFGNINTNRNSGGGNAFFGGSSAFTRTR